MLYLFLTGEEAAGQSLLLRTLGEPTGAQGFYSYTVTGAPRVMTQVAARFSAVSGGRPERCLICRYDKQRDLFLPLRLGRLDSISGHRNGHPVPARVLMSDARHGRLDLLVRVTLGERVAQSPVLFTASLRATVGTALPTPQGGSQLVFHRADPTPGLVTADVAWRMAAQALCTSPEFVRQGHTLALRTEILAIPARRERLLRVQGENFGDKLITVGSVTDHTLSHIQAVPPHSNFEFFAPLPFPAGPATAVIDLAAKFPLVTVK